MTDNFDLRQFLTENKLTKNTQLLKEKAPLSSLEVGDLIYAQGVSGDNIVVKDKKEDGTVGIGHPHSDRISYHDGSKEVQVVKRASLKEAKSYGDKKFTKKETKTDLKETKMETTFDLRKFLVENKMTRNSRMLKEGVEDEIVQAFSKAGVNLNGTTTLEIDEGRGQEEKDFKTGQEALNYVQKIAQNSEGVDINYEYSDPGGFWSEGTVLVINFSDSMGVAIVQYPEMNEARVEGFDVNKKAFEVSFTDRYGGVDFRILNAETPEQAEEVFTNIFVNNPDQVQSIRSIEPYQVPAPKPQAQSQPGLEGVNYGSIEIDGVDSNDYPDFVDAYVTYAEFEDGTPLSEEELEQLTDELYQSGELADMAAETLYEGKKKPVMEAKSYKVSKNSKEAQHLKKGDIIGSGDEVVSVSAGARTPSGKVEVTLKTKDGKTKTSTWGKTTKVGVKETETVKENKMTQRDKYLTRLVENALGLEVTEDDNVDYTMGRHNDPNQLPNPAPEITIPEGEEIVEEKPMPKYESIEKLMQEIDKSTDQEAHKFKMQEMKRVADGLEKKATALEEGDDADHIDQKKLKQMKKDIMALRKGIEKMEKIGDKKFTKKETKTDLKETKMETTFDLRKFLVENKMTRNSRMLKEGVEDEIVQAFSKAGVNLNGTTTLEIDEGRGQEEKDFKTGQEALNYVQKIAQNSEGVDINYEYSDPGGFWSEGTVLVINFSDSMGVAIVQYPDQP